MTKYFKSLQERRDSDTDEGFTLIELLIVIVVLGILAAVVVFALGSVTGNAKASACQADAKQIVTAVQSYNAQKAPTLITAETYAAGVYGTTQQALLVSNGYLSAWPSTNNSYTLRLASTNDAGAAGDVYVSTDNGATWTNYKNEVPASGSGSTAVVATGCFVL